MAAEQLGHFPSLSAYFWGTRVCNSIETGCINRKSAHCAINALIWRFHRYERQGSSWNVALKHILVRVSVPLIAQILRGILNCRKSRNHRHRSLSPFANRSATFVFPSPSLTFGTRYHSVIELSLLLKLIQKKQQMISDNNSRNC